MDQSRAAFPLPDVATIARRWRANGSFSFGPPSSSRLSPAECARHKVRAVSASICRMPSGARAIFCANAIKARFSASWSGGREGRRHSSAVEVIDRGSGGPPAMAAELWTRILPVTPPQQRPPEARHCHAGMTCPEEKSSFPPTGRVKPADPSLASSGRVGGAVALPVKCIHDTNLRREPAKLATGAGFCAYERHVEPKVWFGPSFGSTDHAS